MQLTSESFSNGSPIPRELAFAVIDPVNHIAVSTNRNPTTRLERLIPRKAGAPAETHASSSEEVISILELLKNAKELHPLQRIQSQVAVGLMFFAGLRPGEARGASWEDYNGKTLSVKHSVWRTHKTVPKTQSAARPVPIIDPLRQLLAELHELGGSPSSGPNSKRNGQTSQPKYAGKGSHNACRPQRRELLQPRRQAN